ncbi:hypothetical protein EV127DRAFT_492466 [Xylaria flabelliformis]|nr:hypothetical protein EV127DRAFT_492466 [Xylaria flabelliformis]
MAASDDPRVKFGLSCPEGGDFHICQDSSTRFIGCCDVDPCTTELDGKCPIPNLFNASFSAASGVEFLPQSCATPFNSSTWFTCTYARPPFLGCCTNDPCNNGCVVGNLIPATLSEDPANAAQFILPKTTTTTATTTSSGPSPTATSDEVPESSSKRIGTIVGTSLTGVVILLLVIGAYLWLKRREEAQEEQARQPGGSFFTTSPNNNLTTPPVDKSEFLAVNSNQPSRNRQVNSTSPSVSENAHSAHLSQLSELEGTWQWNH